ncbi:hypothetical protein [Romboutsia ilealis]|nr:hypothetical protein [Romboutsia ilealis]
MTENVLSLFKNNRNKDWYFIKDGVKVSCRSGSYLNYKMGKDILLIFT